MAVNMLFYKVVKNGSSISCDKNPFSVGYNINTTTTPILTDSKLFVFKRLKHAVNFVHNFNTTYGFEIYLCLVNNPEPIKSISLFPLDVTLRKTVLQNFWNSKTFAVTNAPEGTYVCDSVTLIRKIEL